MLTVEEVAEKLRKLIFHISHSKEIPEITLLDFDEIVGELSYEVVKTYRYYENRNKSDGELMLLIKRSVDNRMAELLKKYLYTHRSLGNYPVDLDGLTGDDYDDGDMSYYDVSVRSATIKAVMHADDELIASRERVRDTLDRLSPVARHVLEEILSGNDLIAMNVQLSVERAANVYKTRTAKVSLQTWHVADSLGLDVAVVRDAFDEISNIYQEICDERV